MSLELLHFLVNRTSMYILPSTCFSLFCSTNVSYISVITFASDRWFGLVDIGVHKEVQHWVERGSLECHRLHHVGLFPCLQHSQ